MQMKRIAACVLSAMLAACGGGADAPTGFNVEAAFTALFTQGASFPNLHASETQGGTTVVFTESHAYQPQGLQPFAGGSQQAVLHTWTTDGATAPTPQAHAETLYFSTNPLKLAGLKTEVGEQVYDTLSLLPTNAQVGTGGLYAQSRGAGATSNFNWTLEASDTPGMAWACLQRMTVGGSGASGGTCLKIDMQGHISAARVEYRLLGRTLLFQSGQRAG